MFIEISRWYLEEVWRQKTINMLVSLFKQLDKDTNYSVNPLSNEDTFIVMHRSYYKRLTDMPPQFNAPSLDLQNKIEQSVQKYFFDLPPDKVGAVYGVTSIDKDGNKQSNAVIVVRAGGNLEVGGYIGKTWGEKGVEVGAEAKFYF